MTLMTRKIAKGKQIDLKGESMCRVEGFLLEGKAVKAFKENRRRRQTSPTLNFAGSQPATFHIMDWNHN